MTTWSNKENLSRYNKYIVLLLPLISTLFWLASIIQAKQVEMGDYGLFSVLPWTFYVGFYLLMASIYYTVFVYKEDSRNYYKWLLIFQCLLLMAFIFFTPALIERTARASHSWLKYGYTDYIVRNNHISQNIWYHNWPAPFIFSAQFVQITSINPIHFPLIFPLIMDIIILAVILLIFSRFFINIKTRLFGILIFYLIIWENQFHYAPQIFAFFIFLFLVFFIHFYFLNNNYDFRIIIIVGILFTFLTLTHLLTAAVTFLYLGLVVFYNLFIARGFEMLKKQRNKIMILIVAIISVLVIWFLFASEWVQNAHWELNPKVIFSLVSAYFSKLSEGSNAHSALVMIRMVFAILVVVLAVFLSTRIKEKKNRTSVYLLIVASIVPVFFFYYGVEIVQRAYLFCCLPLTVLIVLGINRKKILAIVIAFSFIALPLHILSHYGNEQIDYIPASEISAAEIIYINIDNVSIALPGSVVSSRYIEEYVVLTLEQVNNPESLSGSTYLMYTTSAKNMEQWYYGRSNYKQRIDNAAKSYNGALIYFSPECHVYKIR